MGQMRATGGFLVKPFTSTELNKAVQENLRKKPRKLSLGEIREEVGKLTQLPVLSPNHRKILSLVAQEDFQVDIPALVRAIEADHGMATTVMRISHSAYYGFRGSKVEGAVTFIGINGLRKIIQAAVVFDVFAGERDKDMYGGFSVMEL